LAVGRWPLAVGRWPLAVRAGFTLIELLVVVIIIGILAAIALPQYQQAVEKSRASDAIINARTIANANEIFYLTQGKYSNDIGLLDIEFKGTYTGPDVNGFTWINVDNGFQYWAGSGGGGIGAARRGGLSLIARQKDMLCIAHDKKYDKLCKNLGGTLSQTTGYNPTCLSINCYVLNK
jgi:prepilin-type N-terminal cleavage/methylation domain-containing protein